MDPEVISHETAAWDTTISGLRKQCDDPFKPDNSDYIVCGRTIPTASNGAQAFPDAYYRLKKAALRDDLTLVETIYEEEWLPHTATSQFSNKDLYNVFCEALKARHTPVVAFLLSQNVPFRQYHSEIAVEQGMESLL